MTENQLMAITVDYLPRINLSDSELEDKVILYDGRGGSYNEKQLFEFVTKKTNRLNMSSILSDIYNWNDEIFQEMAMREALNNHRLNGELIPDSVEIYDLMEESEELKGNIMEFYDYSGYDTEDTLIEFIYNNKLSLLVDEDTFCYENILYNMSSFVNMDKKILINPAQILMFEELYKEETQHEFETKRTDIYDVDFFRYYNPKYKYDLLVNCSGIINCYGGD